MCLHMCQRQSRRIGQHMLASTAWWMKEGWCMSQKTCLQTDICCQSPMSDLTCTVCAHAKLNNIFCKVLLKMLQAIDSLMLCGSTYNLFSSANLVPDLLPMLMSSTSAALQLHCVHNFNPIASLRGCLPACQVE